MAFALMVGVFRSGKRVVAAPRIGAGVGEPCSEGRVPDEMAGQPESLGIALGGRCPVPAVAAVAFALLALMALVFRSGKGVLVATALVMPSVRGIRLGIPDEPAVRPKSLGIA